MKAIKFLLGSLVFVVGFLIAAWFFMPWAQIGEYALLSATRELKTPASVNYAAVENTRGGFVIRDLSARSLMGLLNFSCKTLTIRPALGASLFNAAPTVRVSFTGNALEETAILLKKIPAVHIGDGGVTVSLGRREILLEEARSDGDLSLNGVMALAPGAERIIARADVAIAIKSEAFEKELPALQQALGLPLQQESPGRWRLRRDRPVAPAPATPPKEVQPSR